MPFNFKVQIGRAQPLLNGSVKVAKVIRHPKYNISQEEPGGADVALLQLAAPVTPSNLVKWVALPPASFMACPGMKCWVTGWGDINSSGKDQDDKFGGRCSGVWAKLCR